MAIGNRSFFSPAVGLSLPRAFFCLLTKETKTAERLFSFADFLRLAASATEPLALQARLDGLLLQRTFASLIVICQRGGGLKSMQNKRTPQAAAWNLKFASTIRLMSSLKHSAGVFRALRSEPENKIGTSD